MRLDIIGDDRYKVFINNLYLDNLDLSSNSELGKYVKVIILKLRTIYDITLEGFYEVDIYPVNNIGLIVEINNIDKYIGKTIDLRIVVHTFDDVYLKIKNDDLALKYKRVMYFDNNYYINSLLVDEKDINNLCEDYNLIYGKELKLLKSKWRSLV